LPRVGIGPSAPPAVAMSAHPKNDAGEAHLQGRAWPRSPTTISDPGIVRPPHFFFTTTAVP
jgi:hypothetical protein